MRIAILQPIIPHYRESFFKGLKKDFDVDIFCYETKKEAKKNSFKVSDLNEKIIKKKSYGAWLLYNPAVFFSKKYSHLILMWHFGHLTTWFLLITKFIHKKKITIWGQGISVKRYLKEEKKASFLLMRMAGMADTIWVYTEKEKEQWVRVFPKKEIVALNNTISGIEKIVDYQSLKSKKQLKNEYKILQPINFIFCARFNNHYRRQDLLLQIIKKLDNKKIGFIIIGDGEAKPDFSNFNNVYDYGAVYNDNLKQDLFTIADMYIQPGWVGLSVVEALGYGKPVITFKRSKSVLQCVEYHYLINKHNALVFRTTEELVSTIENITKSKLQLFQNNAKEYVVKNLMMDDMVKKAIMTIKKNRPYEDSSFSHINR